MAWQERTKRQMKEEFINLLNSGINMSELCRRYNISRKTGYKWLNRYRENGLEGLDEQSKRPKNSPNTISKDMLELIIFTRLQHRFWGGRKICSYLKSKGHKSVPEASTISNHLKKHGLINSNPNEVSSLKRFEHEAPNRLWQMDFKGHFAMEKGRCHPFDILDDHSRYLLCLKACSNEKRETVEVILEEVFKRYGIPDRINVDNGSPWGNAMHNTRFTVMSLWLVKLGIYVSYSKAYHPQTNGKIERLHRTLKQEVISNHYYKDLADVQYGFDRWRNEYNHERPHEAIDMQTPASKYQASYRSYPERIEEYEYSNDYELVKVDSRGRFYFKKKEFFISTPLAREVLGIRPCLEDGIFNVYFRHQMIKKISLKS